MKQNQVYGLGDVEVKDHVYENSTATKTLTSLNGDGHVDEEVNTKDSTISKPTVGNMKYENSTKDEDGNEGGYDYVDEKINSKGKGGKERRRGKTPKNKAQSSKGKNTSQQNTKGLYYNG